MLTKARENQLNFLSAMKNNNINYLQTYGPVLSKADLNARDNQKNTALYYACCNNNYDMVHSLLRLGADPYLECQGNNVPMHEAFRVKNAKMVKLLHSRGC